MKILFLVLIIFVINGCGIYDYQKAKSLKIIGRIYVVNLNLPEHPGYIVVFQEKSGFERHFLKLGESIDYLKSDDSIMLVKTNPKPEIKFYLIRHDKGDSIIDAATLNDFEFEEYEQAMKAKYVFPRSP